MLMSMAFFISCDNNTPDAKQPSQSRPKDQNLSEPDSKQPAQSPPKDQNLSEQDQVLIDFYRQKPVTFDKRKVTINEFWNYSNDELESEHNYVQWLFPNAREGLSPAPILSKETVEIMRTDPEIKKNVLKSLDTMLKFLGYSRDDTSCALQRNADFDERAENWIIKHTHNHLRMTRLLLFLKYMGLDNCAKNLFNEFTLLKNDDKYKNSITQSYNNYWHKASMGIEGDKKYTELLPNL